MSFIDDVIADRLRKLKGEAQLRLNGNENKQPLILPSKTQVEQVEDLLQEISEEASLDSSGIEIAESLDEEIRSRLDRLKAKNTLEESESKEKDRRSETIEEIVNRFKHFADLENSLESSLPKAPSLNPLTATTPVEGEPEEELPWCSICNEDATLLCIGCDNDLYCNGCYMEFHSSDDYKDHAKKPYKSSK